jgi:hypothetical protein
MTANKYCARCKAYYQPNVVFCALCGSALIRLSSEADKAEASHSGTLENAKKKRSLAEAATILIHRYGLGKTMLILACGMLFMPLLDMIGDEGTLGKYFSNTQNPPG